MVCIAAEQFATIEMVTGNEAVNDATVGVFASVKVLEAQLADAHQITGKDAERLMDTIATTANHLNCLKQILHDIAESQA